MESKQLAKSNPYFPQIDYLKALLIIIVIIDHSIPNNVKILFASSIWERLAIPIFLVVTGFNLKMSLDKSPHEKLRQIYSKAYFINRIRRYVIPFFILYGITTLIGMIYYGSFSGILTNSFDHVYPRPLLVLGLLPFWGPGDWYFPIIMQSILIFPLLYKLYQKYPRVSLIFGFLWDFCIHLGLALILGPPYTWTSPTPWIIRLFFQLSFCFFFSAMMLGMWMADQVIKQTPSPLSTTTKTPVPSVVSQTDQLKKIPLIINPSFLMWLKGGLIIGVLAVFFMIVFSQRITFEQKLWPVFIFLILIWGLTTIFLLRSERKLTIYVFIIAIACVILAYCLLEYYIQIKNQFPLRVYVYCGFYLVFLLPIILNLFLRFPPFKFQNYWIILSMFPTSAIYICYYQFLKFRFEFVIGDYNFFTIIYGSLAVIISLKLFSSRQSQRKQYLKRYMQILGQATYHILCTQMIYFSILFAVLKNHYYQNELVQWVLGSSFSESEYYISMTIYLLIAWCINIPLGIIWYLVEQRIIKMISKRKTSIVMDSHGDK